MELICYICNNKYEKSTGHYNRAMKLGLSVYCGKVCTGIGRRSNKTEEQKKAEKSEYDKKRLNGDKREEILAKKKAYHQENREWINEKQKVYNKTRTDKHAAYCRQPEQRAKERIRNRKKAGLDKIKTCICCGLDKELIQFESFHVFPDKRLYMCKSCEEKDKLELNITMREVLANLRTSLIKSRSNLKVSDVCKHPYLIEAHKYLLLLKRLTK